MIILNSLKVLNEDYSQVKELEKMIPIGEYGLTIEFYGGQVQYLGYIKGSKFIQLINGDGDGLQVIDTAVDKAADISIEQIRKFAEQKIKDHNAVDADKKPINKRQLEPLKPVMSKQEIISFLADEGKILIVERGEPVINENIIDLRAGNQ